MPFEFVEPELPEGASFSWLAVRLPTARLDQESRERITTLRMHASPADAAGLFSLLASRLGTTPGGGETTTVDVGSAAGTFLDDGNTATLGWRSCDVGYLIAYDPALLSHDAALAIAVSIDDRCG